MRQSLIFIAFTVIIAIFAPLTTCADQNDERLNELFQTLQQTSDLLELRNTELEIWKIWTDSGHEEINQLMNQGIAAMQSRHYDEALVKFNEVIEKAPDFAEGWNKRATVYYLRQQLSQSMQDVQKTLALEPRHFGALSGIGLIFMEIGDQIGAIKAFEEVLKLHPHSPGTQNNLEQLRSSLRDRAI